MRLLLLVVRNKKKSLQANLTLDIIVTYFKTNCSSKLMVTLVHFSIKSENLDRTRHHGKARC